ncbi:MAG: hypothetical protein FWE44_03305 [Defluviitaleaceae bacterium]|nr:hypothetical protein [Defluviitaleaceae bacterium]
MKANKRNFVIITPLALIMIFGVFMVCGFGIATEVAAAESRNSTNNTQASFDFDALRQSGNEMRATFPCRFPNVSASNFIDVNFNGSWDSVVGNLEINLLNANLRIEFHTDEILERNRWNSSLNDHRRVFIESSGWSTAYSMHTFGSGSSRNRNIYVWDNNSAYDALVTIHVPLYDNWLFEQVNIHLENGSLEIDESIKEFLTENLNITVVNGSINGHETQPINLTEAIGIARNHSWWSWFFR